MRDVLPCISLLIYYYIIHPSSILVSQLYNTYLSVMFTTWIALAEPLLWLSTDWVQGGHKFCLPPAAAGVGGIGYWPLAQVCN